MMNDSIKQIKDMAERMKKASATTLDAVITNAQKEISKVEDPIQKAKLQSLMSQAQSGQINMSNIKDAILSLNSL